MRSMSRRLVPVARERLAEAELVADAVEPPAIVPAKAK
jgi:hypothetical protein